jgi:hypothetical protein
VRQNSSTCVSVREASQSKVRPPTSWRMLAGSAGRKPSSASRGPRTRFLAETGSLSQGVQAGRRALIYYAI